MGLIDRPATLTPQQIGHGDAEGAIAGRRRVVAYQPLEGVAVAHARRHPLAQARFYFWDAAGVAAAEHDHVLPAGHGVAQIIHQLQDAAVADELLAEL